VAEHHARQEDQPKHDHHRNDKAEPRAASVRRHSPIEKNRRHDLAGRCRHLPGDHRYDERVTLAARQSCAAHGN
jgi:hypothetical protein